MLMLWSLKVMVTRAHWKWEYRTTNILTNTRVDGIAPSQMTCLMSWPDASKCHGAVELFDWLTADFDLHSVNPSTCFQKVFSLAGLVLMLCCHSQPPPPGHQCFALDQLSWNCLFLEDWLQAFWHHSTCIVIILLSTLVSALSLVITRWLLF